jgi:hypothetical protein
MRLSLFLLLFNASFLSTWAQHRVPLAEIKANYEQVYSILSKGLESGKIGFRDAVFRVENAYYDNHLDTAGLRNAVEFIASECNHFVKTNKLNYEKKDKAEVEKWASIFTLMTDTTLIKTDSAIIYSKPFVYDFDDFWGEQSWENMFVSKLLGLGSGNCHSMPYLYKMIAEELGTTAHLALAPNHIYIKHRSAKDGWYNTELTSAAFPIDAWIMVSGYVHLDAIENGIYMKALNEKESIALCMIDLAEGYMRKTNDSDLAFVLKCCDAALQYFPDYINALLLKAETLKKQYGIQLKENSNPSPEVRVQLEKRFSEMQELYVHIHKLGYRQMPKEMYLKWLVELKTEKEKYQNKKVARFNGKE